jgi:hypothetical protein
MIQPKTPTLKTSARHSPPGLSPKGGAILQPSKPSIHPSERILERTADRDLHLEAAD